MRKTLGMRLLLGYNALFAWRRRREGADGWISGSWDDENTAVAYGRWRHDETPKFLRRFPPIDFAGKTVVDFGCSHGGSCVYYAEQGAAKVIGVDIGERQLQLARHYLKTADPDQRLPIDIRLGTHTRAPIDDASVDLLLCADVFEHVLDPVQVLSEWQRVLKPGGRAFLSFGPPWLHPHGVHLWELFPAPWTHLLFAERTVVATRHYLKQDDLDPNVCTHYRDLGFNQMTIGRFLRLLRDSRLRVEKLELCPVKNLKPLVWLPLLREFFVTEVHCVLQREHA